jgi:hypothetical protein
MVQRLFSSFPDGRPGAGLLLLRIAIGIALVVQSQAWNDATLQRALVFAIAAGLVAGFMTPLLALVAGATAGFGPYPFVVAIGASLALLGPGAYSLDARWFGRREIVIDER